MGNFELQWDDYEGNLVTSFKDLREEGELFDVTLACEDDQVNAHKVILSATSSFFQSIIKRNPHAHPLIYLKGVKLQHLAALLDFIYFGTAKVAQDDVKSFLALGEELGVKGLTKMEKETEPPTPILGQRYKTISFQDFSGRDEFVEDDGENGVKTVQRNEGDAKSAGNSLLDSSDGEEKDTSFVIGKVEIDTFNEKALKDTVKLEDYKGKDLLLDAKLESLISKVEGV